MRSRGATAANTSPSLSSTANPQATGMITRVGLGLFAAIGPLRQALAHPIYEDLRDAQALRISSCSTTFFAVFVDSCRCSRP